MRESIGSTFLYNMIFVYILIVFAFLTGIMGFYKSYKINVRILNYIAQYNGYNKYSYEKIENYLSSIGYQNSNNNFIQNQCPTNKGKSGEGNLITSSNAGLGSTTYQYCIYYYNDDNSDYYSYGVISYLSIDLPIVDELKVPVFSKGKKIYKFIDGTNKSCQKGFDCNEGSNS